MSRLDELYDEPPARPSVLPVYLLTLATFILLFAGFLLSTGLTVIVQVLRGAVSLRLLEDNPDAALQLSLQGASIIVVSVLVTGVLLSGVALLAGSRRGRLMELPSQTVMRRFWMRPVPALDLLIAALGMLGVSLVLDGLIHALGLSDVGSLAHLREGLLGLSGLERVAVSIVMGASPGIAEELFFRGYMLRRLEDVAGARHALLGSSLAFGLFHFDLVHSPAAAVLGVYLGFCALRTRSIWTGIVAHTVNNMTATFLELISVEGQGLLWLTLCGAVGAAAAIRLLLDRHPPLASRPW